MNHLIVVAHPLDASVTMKLARAYAAELERMGHNSTMHDLYRMNFDPVMPASELEPLSRDVPVRDDVKSAQAAIAASQVMTVIYPLWWASMPAILKGYVDRVLARGFAYQGAGGETQGLLEGRDCVLVTLSGSPAAALHNKGEWNAIEVLQDAHVFRSCGFRLLEHLHFGLVEPPVGSNALDTHIQRVEDCARRHFDVGG